MPIKMADPTFDLKNRKREIDTRSPYDDVRDEQELKEREEAADAYSGENERHFVDYVNDCLKQSIRAWSDIRKIQGDCWNVYNENEPVSYADKEDWQARIVVPKPFETVQYGAAAVKKAFSPNFLSIKNFSNKAAGEFWQTVMERNLGQNHSDFIIRFTDAVTMALAVGQGMEMIPRWVPGKGLEYTLVEPWKIQRDPDALSRDAQSGMFWIHQEWLDYFVLKQGEKDGRYFDVDRVKEVNAEDPDNPFMTKEAIAARKDAIWERSAFRKMVLTSEFWGIVLDPKGEMLLPRARLTIAGNRVIQKPKAPPYPALRWPGVGFSPLPNILGFGGRGLLEGILTIWEAMNNIMCLHQDYLSWVVNPPTEINVDALVDPNDSKPWPGKEYLTRDTMSGQQAVRTVQRRSRTNDVLSNMQYYDQTFQRGSMVTDGVQGLPGYRQDITFKEASMNLDQAMGVYGLMGENIERGAVESVSAGMEIIKAHAGYADYKKIFSEEELERFGIAPNPETSNGVAGVPDFDGSFHISGIQALMRENETLKAIREIFVELAAKEPFSPYIRPYKLLKAIVERVNLNDEDVIVDQETADAIQGKTADRAEAEEAAADAAREVEEVRRIAEVANQLEGGRENEESSSGG